MTNSPGSTTRLSVRASSDTTGDVRRVLEKLEATANNRKFLRMLANAGEPFRPFVLLSSTLLSQGLLPPTVREVAILEAAVVSGATYEQEQHVDLARLAGLDEAQISSIQDRIEADHLFTHEQRLSRNVARELLTGVGVSDDRWGEIVGAWGEAGAAELLMVVGLWGGMLPVILRGLLLETEKDDPP